MGIWRPVSDLAFLLLVSGCYVLVCFWDRVLLCSLGCPATDFVDQPGHESSEACLPCLLSARIIHVSSWTARAMMGMALRFLNDKEVAGRRLRKFL